MYSPHPGHWQRARCTACGHIVDDPGAPSSKDLAADIATRGDYIVVERGDGHCDVERIRDSGERVTPRENVSFNEAREIARAGADEQRGRVWISHRSDPHNIRPF
jgi:hypothetical protein